MKAMKLNSISAARIFSLLSIVVLSTSLYTFASPGGTQERHPSTAQNLIKYAKTTGDKTMAISSSADSAMDMIMLYDDDYGPEIKTWPDSGWLPLYPGYPNDPIPGGVLGDNLYYIKRASDGAVLDSARPPESDQFRWQRWNVSQYIGTDAYIEIVDRDTGSSDAWIAADDFILGSGMGNTLDFESGSYAPDWQVISGTAFGLAPDSVSHGSMSGQEGKFWADSRVGGESAVGVLRSRTFTIMSNVIMFLKAGWDGPGGDGPWRSTTPLWGLYSSQDSAVIKQHAYWIRALGCNAMVCDLTNSGPVAPGGGGYYGGLNETFEIIMKTLAGINDFEAPSAYPAIRLSGTDYSGLKSMLDIVHSIYEKYPTKWYKLDDGTANKDKPFIEIFADWSLLNEWATSGVPFNDDRFNIRWTNGYLLSQPSITRLDNNNIHYIPGNVPFWLFVENTQDPSKGSGYYEPVYKEMPNGGGVEQMITWASVSLGGDIWAWDGLRDTVDGKTPIVRYTEPVFNLNPKVLLVCRFNYPMSWPAYPAEGLSLNNSTHIEPNVDWGFLEFDDVANELYSVRGWNENAPPKPERESFDGANNILKIDLTGFPLEYRISNNDSLSGAQWTFLNVGQGGIKINSGIDESKPIYLQTRNSFGESPIAGIELTSVEQADNRTPTNFTLSQNYPNPFNPTTEIKYSVPRNGFVTLKVYNILGQEVANLFSGNEHAGNYTANFDGSRFASGVYFYRLDAGTTLLTKKMVLMK